MAGIIASHIAECVSVGSPPGRPLRTTLRLLLTCSVLSAAHCSTSSACTLLARECLLVGAHSVLSYARTALLPARSPPSSIRLFHLLIDCQTELTGGRTISEQKEILLARTLCLRGTTNASLEHSLTGAHSVPICSLSAVCRCDNSPVERHTLLHQAGSPYKLVILHSILTCDSVIAIVWSTLCCIVFVAHCCTLLTCAAD